MSVKQRNLDRLKAGYAAWNESKGGSLDVWAEVMADTFCFNEIDETTPGLEFAVDRMSKEEALKNLSAIFDQWDMVHYTPETYVCEDDRIAMFGRCAYRNKATGKVADCRIACLWRFEGEKAVELTEIFDSAVAARAAMA
jgi:ketosteroid isomerase-like protein